MGDQFEDSIQHKDDSEKDYESVDGSEMGENGCRIRIFSHLTLWIEDLFRLDQQDRTVLLSFINSFIWVNKTVKFTKS